MSFRKIRETQFQETLKKFRQRFGAPSAHVVLTPTPRQHDPIEGSRGILSGNQAWPPKTEKAESKTDVLDQLSDRTTDQVLQCGEWFRIGMRTPKDGHAFLFNLGVSGGTSRLTPISSKTAPWISHGATYYLTEEGDISEHHEAATPFEETCHDSAHLVYPERLLLIISLNGHEEINETDLHSDWIEASRSGFGKICQDTSAFWERKPESLAWGLLELPVIE